MSFKLISWGSFYGIEPGQVREIEESLDSLENDPNTTDQNKKAYKFFKKLQNKGLLTSPYIHLKIGADSILAVYLSESEYEKVRDFEHNDLRERNKKIEIELDIKKIDDEIYYSENIISAREVDGETIVRK